MSALREAMSHAVLGWVKPELDESLRQVRNEIEAFVEEPADTSRMRFCSGYLHQVQGTLRMVELYAPAMVAEELELLAQALQEQQVEDVDAACAVLMRGAVLLPDYLERLQDGHRDIPIVLLPLLNEIRDARGAAGLNENMLFPAGAPEQDAPTEEEIDHARGSLSGRNRALLDTVGSAVKEELLRVKDALDLHLRTSADAAQLHGQVTELGNVADTLGMMGLGVARGVVLQQRDTLRDVAEGRRAANEDTLLDIAGALLYVDASLDDQVARLGHADASHVESGSAAESQATVEVLAQEAINNFAAAREKFVAFIETNWSHEQLADVPRLLDEVSGALRMLELGQAADYLVGVRRYVGSELINKKRIPGGQQLDTLADAMASLEYYLEALRERRPNREEILEITRNSLETLRYWPLPDEELFTPSVADPMVDVPAIPDIPPANDAADHAQPASSETPVADASSHPFDPIGFEEAGQPAPDVAASPAEAMPPALQEAKTAADALSLQPLEFEGQEAAAGHMAEAATTVADATPVVAAPTRQSAAVGGVDGFDSESGDIDDEIREVFLEEFDEEIVNLQRMLPNWRSAPEDLERLRPIRRVFHTLKGSGRLVGAKTLGEFSWKVENMLNRVLDGSRPPSEAVVVLLEQSCDVLPQLNAALRGEGTISADLEGLKQVADQLAAGEEASYQPAPLAAFDSEPALELEDEIPAVAWDEDEIEPASAWQESTEGTPASVDAVLREILEVEVATHLRTVQAWLAQADADATVDDALLRALHTMNGAFAMADVPEITEVTNPAEQYVKRLLAQSASADADGVAALGDVVQAIQDTIAALQRPMPRVPVFADLSARLAALKDRLPEARHSQLVNSAQQGSYVGGLAGAEDASIDAAAEPTLQVHDLSQYLGEGTAPPAPANPVNYFEVEYTFTPRAHSSIIADGEQAAAAAGLSAAPLADALREGLDDNTGGEATAPEMPSQSLSDDDAAASADASESWMQETPAQEPPMEEPPAEQPPVQEPPVEEPPAQEPPAEQPPVEQPPVEQPPAQDADGFEPAISYIAADAESDPASTGADLVDVRMVVERSTDADADLITLELDSDTETSDQAPAWADPGAGLDIEEITLDGDTAPVEPTDADEVPSLQDEALADGGDDSRVLANADLGGQASPEVLETTDSASAAATGIDDGAAADVGSAGDTAVVADAGMDSAADLQAAEAESTQAAGQSAVEEAAVEEQSDVQQQAEVEQADVETGADFEADIEAEAAVSDELAGVDADVDSSPDDASTSVTAVGDAGVEPMMATDSDDIDEANAGEPRDLDESGHDDATDNGDDALDTSGLDLELVDIFVEEGNDLLDHSDGLLAQLSETPDDRALLTSLQRDLHTLKGGARMAGIHSIGDLGHAIESMLEAIVGDRIQLDPRAMQLMERGFDALHGMVGRVSSQRAAHIPAGMVAEFNAHARGLDAPAAPLPEAGPAAAQADAERKLAPLSAPVETDFGQDEEFFPSSQQEQVRVRSDLLDQLVNHAGEVAIYRARLEQQLGAFRGAMSELDRTNTRLHDQLRRLDLETEAQIVARYQREHEKPDATFDPLELDRFSTLQQLSRALAESAADLTGLQGVLDELARQYDGLLHQQSRVSSELQDGLMRARMVPFEGIVPRLRRVLRQAASDTGKQVKLQLSGTHGEMDRNVLERMTAPLEHLMRNSVAHGLETPQARRAAGKPAEGNVQVTLRREGSEMVLEVTDDGAGLNRDAIRKRAEQRGLLQPGVQLADVDLDRMILESGFSTYDKVSQLAGRGVGMDVVHNEVRQLGGSLDIRSNPGQGATFTLRLPQTLAVTQAVFVQIGDTQFAVPVAAVSGIGRISRERFEADGGVYHYAGEDYTLYNLGGLVGHPPARAEGQPQVPLLLVRAGELRAAVAVDAVLGNREIVVKPVGPQIASIPGIYGATITGDGSIVVILDVAPLVRRHLAAPQQPTSPSAALQQRHVPLVMVVDDSLTMRKVTSRVLERHNLEVMVARDGVEALERLDERVPDLMLLDIEMPRMDGYELATAMKNDPRFKDVPIVMITSRTGDKHRQRAFDIGVQRYMGKPYQELDLMRNVYDLLGMARVRD